MGIAVAPPPDVLLWLRGSGLEIVLLVLGAILLTRFATWLGGVITARIDAKAAGDDALVRSEEAKHRHALTQVLTWAALVVVYCVDPRADRAAAGGADHRAGGPGRGRRRGARLRRAAPGAGPARRLLHHHRAPVRLRRRHQHQHPRHPGRGHRHRRGRHPARDDGAHPERRGHHHAQRVHRAADQPVPRLGPGGRGRAGAGERGRQPGQRRPAAGRRRGVRRRRACTRCCSTRRRSWGCRASRSTSSRCAWSRGPCPASSSTWVGPCGRASRRRSCARASTCPRPWPPPRRRTCRDRAPPPPVDLAADGRCSSWCSPSTSWSGRSRRAPRRSTCTSRCGPAPGQDPRNPDADLDHHAPARRPAPPPRSRRRRARRRPAPPRRTPRPTGTTTSGSSPSTATRVPAGPATSTPGSAPLHPGLGRYAGPLLRAGRLVSAAEPAGRRTDGRCAVGAERIDRLHRGRARRHARGGSRA